jgi:hypothetical protein
LCLNLRVSFLVALQFFTPKLNSGLRHSIAHGTIMLVPKATVNKDNLFSASKHHIWMAWEILGMKAVSVAHSVNQLPNTHFWFRVLGSYQRHPRTTFGWRKRVIHFSRVVPDKTLNSQLLCGCFYKASIIWLLAFSCWKHDHGRERNTGSNAVRSLKHGE